MTPRRPQLLTLLPRSRALWPTLLLGVGLPLALLAFLAQHFAYGSSLAFESSLAGLLRGGRTAEKDALARALDVSGSGWVILPLSAILAGVLYRVRRRLGWFVVWVVGGASLLHLSVRALVDRPRPTLPETLVNAPGTSFPSGHVVFMAALVLTVTVLLWPTWARWIALPLGVLAVAAMMWSRVYVGVHHPADVVAGALLALGWGLAVTSALRPHHRQDQ